MVDFSTRPITDFDRDWIKQFIIDRWGAEIVVVHGVVYRPHELDGFVATHAVMVGRPFDLTTIKHAVRTVERDQPIGLITYHLQDTRCEIVTLDSLMPGNGIGTALIEAAKASAKQSGCKQMGSITTNDNVTALRFYQKRGFELVAVHRSAIERSRQIKPEIPLIGEHGIPLRDEIELELNLPHEEERALSR
jgi:GNAT superfamily N-acetyltransferase